MVDSRDGGIRNGVVSFQLAPTQPHGQSINLLVKSRSCPFPLASMQGPPTECSHLATASRLPHSAHLVVAPIVQFPGHFRLVFTPEYRFRAESR